MHKRICKRNVVGLLLCGLLLTAVGCGSKIETVDENSARTTLTKALDAWKAGTPQSALSQQDPPISVGEIFWESGRKLASYKVNGSGTADTRGNLRVPVTLELQAPKGTEKIEATYVVTVSPKMTVVREFQD